MVDTFDPTLTEGELQRMKGLKILRIHEIGLTGDKNTAKALKRLQKGIAVKRKHLSSFSVSAGAKMMRFDQIMTSLGHSFVHILKVDCEGCEDAFIAHLKSISMREKPFFGQILIEIHRC